MNHGGSAGPKIGIPGLRNAPTLSNPAGFTGFGYLLEKPEGGRGSRLADRQETAGRLPTSLAKARGRPFPLSRRRAGSTMAGQSRYSTPR
jgi:hypothetical protein